MYDIEMQTASEAFAEAWRAAGRHIQGQGAGEISWLKGNLAPPFLEHMSFRLGNQLFFIRIEDASGTLEVPGSREGLRGIAVGCRGHALLLPMIEGAGGWRPHLRGWGLVDPNTKKPVRPPDLVTRAKVEMTDWEMHDFAVQIVRGQLEKEGWEVISVQGSPHVEPAIWFVGDSGPEWVVVRACRYPQKEPDMPGNWQAIAAHCAAMGKVGHFAPVSVASADEKFQTGGKPAPLWRGEGMIVSYQGMRRP